MRTAALLLPVAAQNGAADERPQALAVAILEGHDVV
jgi:hypothetical protein